MSSRRSQKSWGESAFKARFRELSLRLATIFYYRTLKISTIQAVQNIINEKPDSEILPALVSRFRVLKDRECTYIQLAVSGSVKAGFSQYLLSK